MWAVKHCQGELVLKVRFLEMPVSRFLKWNRRVSAFCFWCNCFARSMNSYAQMFLIKCRVALFTHYSKAPFAKPQLINSDRVGFTSESLCWQQHSWLLAFVSLMFNSLKLVSILLIIELQCIYGNISKAMVLHQAFLKLVPDLYPNFVNWLNHSLSKQLFTYYTNLTQVCWTSPLPYGIKGSRYLSFPNSTDTTGSLGS